MSERQRAVEALEQRLGYAFRDKSLLEEALTHSSVLGQGKPKVRHNQRLEFLGDRVLGLLIADALVRLHPGEREGQLTKRLHSLVDGRACAEIARQLDIGPALRMPGAESKRGAREQDAILGDATEALLAAVYVDGGLEAARGVVEREWGSLLAAPPPAVPVSPKTALQEWAAALGKRLPSYEVVDRHGPEHALMFRARVQVDGVAPSEGEGGSRQSAEAAAAHAMLARERSL